MKSVNVKLLHGSKRNDLTELAPQYIGGDNGSQDGIGVNMTADPAVSCHYAGPTGSVYIIETDVSQYLAISDNATLNTGQAEILKMHLATLPKDAQYRLATDICGKASKTFDNDKDAEAFYKEKKQSYNELGFAMDRLKPDIDYDDDGRMKILYAHASFDTLDTINTRRIHYCLNLFDNSIATSLLKTISRGLTLERENGKHNYLSFRESETVSATLDANFITRPDAHTRIEEICQQKDKNEMAYKQSADNEFSL